MVSETAAQREHGIKKAPEHANRAGGSAGRDRCRCAGPALRRTHLLADHQLPRLPVPIEALRPEKYVGDDGDPAPGKRATSAHGTRPRGLDSAAAHGAPALSSGPGVGSFRQRLGHCVSAGRLVCAFPDLAPAVARTEATHAPPQAPPLVHESDAAAPVGEIGASARHLHGQFACVPFSREHYGRLATIGAASRASGRRCQAANSSGHA